MTSPALIERITRSLAYMLRHQPEEFDLELDAQGYGDVERIVSALNERLGEPVTLADLEDAVHSGDRPRYEITGSRVRALYGHSIDVEPGEPSRPPELLYVGISARDADRALRYGLRGGRRRFLHLALTPDDAKEGGRRTGRDYVVITVYSLDAWEEGINFYDRRALFLAEQIPTEFLEIGETCHDGIEPEGRGFTGRREGGSERGRGGPPRGAHREPEMSRPSPASERPEEEEGFGEGSPDAIQVERQRHPQRAGSDSREFATSARPPEEPRGDGGNGFGRRRRGGRNRREFEARPGEAARGPAAPREEGWSDEPTLAGGPRTEGAESRGGDPRQGRFGAERERAPREARESGSERRDFGRGAQESARGAAPEGGRGERSFERPERSERGPERSERGPERSERGPERSERGSERVERAPERGERAPERGERRPERPERNFDRPERSPERGEFQDRPAEGSERRPEWSARAPERSERPPERPDRGGRGFDRGPRPGDGGDRGERRPARTDRPERTERPDRGEFRPQPNFERGGERGPERERFAPERRPAPPERAPTPPPRRQDEERRQDAPGFGLGIFEEPAASKRPAPPPARPSAPPPAPVAPPPPPRNEDPSEGFGAGV